MNRNDMKRIVYFLVSLLGFTKLAAQDPAYGHEIELYTTRQTGKRDKRQ